MPVRLKLDEVMRKFEEEHNAGFTIRAWTKVLDLSVNFLFRAQHGSIKRLDLEKLQKLCAFFKCSPNDLLWDEAEKEEDGE